MSVSNLSLPVDRDSADPTADNLPEGANIDLCFVRLYPGARAGMIYRRAGKQAGPCRQEPHAFGDLLLAE